MLKDKEYGQVIQSAVIIKITRIDREIGMYVYMYACVCMCVCVLGRRGYQLATAPHLVSRRQKGQLFGLHS